MQENNQLNEEEREMDVFLKNRARLTKLQTTGEENALVRVVRFQFAYLAQIKRK
jgi:hypothetical protein